MRTLLAICLLLALPVMASRAIAQTGWDAFGADPFGTEAALGLSDDDPVMVEAQFTAAADERPAVLMVTATMAPGWHTYSLTQPEGGPSRTEISLVPASEYQVIGRFASHPRPVSQASNTPGWEGVRVEEHSGQVTWYIPIELAEGVDPQTLAIEGQVKLQACKEQCLPPDARDFVARLGSGVEIGAIRVNRAATAPAVAQAKPDPLAAPPAEAGVLKVGDSVVTWYGWLDKNAVKPGERVHLYLRAEMPKDWHVNAYAASDSAIGPKPTLIALEPTAGMAWYQPEPAKAPTEKPSPVESWGPQRYHEELAVWTVPIEVAADAAPGSIKIAGKLAYHACEGEERCELHPIGISFTTTLDVGETPATGPTPVTLTQGTYEATADLAASSAPSLSAVGGIPGLATGDLQIIEFGGGTGATSLPYVLLGALAGGLILNLMPCVLPVLGLKIMSFARQGGESRARVFSLNLVYVLGLLTVFMLLATLAALPQLGLFSQGLNWGELNTFNWFKISMTVLVFAMALSFLGVWDIPLPGFVGGAKASELASREGFQGAFFKGMLTTVLATPCSGPFLGPVFGFTIGQGVMTIYLIFLFVGIGMALPYLIIGLNPRLVQWIPKPGAWMDTFKQFMGFVLLATVVYLFSTINSQYFIRTLALCVAVWFACWLGGSQSLGAPLSRRLAGWVTGLGVASFVGIAAFTSLFERDHRLDWIDFSPTAIADAQANGQTVLLEFTANWCPTCQLNLYQALDIASVKGVVENNDVAAIKVDWTDRNPEIGTLVNSLKSKSIPLLAIFPADRPGEVILLRDLVTETQVLQALAQAGAVESNPQRGFVPAELAREELAVARN